MVIVEVSIAIAVGIYISVVGKRELNKRLGDKTNEQ